MCRILLSSWYLLMLHSPSDQHEIIIDQAVEVIDQDVAIEHKTRHHDSDQYQKLDSSGCGLRDWAVGNTVF